MVAEIRFCLNDNIDFFCKAVRRNVIQLSAFAENRLFTPVPINLRDPKCKFTRHFSSPLLLRAERRECEMRNYNNNPGFARGSSFISVSILSFYYGPIPLCEYEWLKVSSVVARFDKCTLHLPLARANAIQTSSAIVRPPSLIPA